MRHITVTQLDQVVYIKLNRPEVRNAFHPEMITELKLIFNQYNHIDPQNDVRAIVLFGEGSSFCAGADLNWMKEMARYSKEQNLLDSENLFAMFAAIRNSVKPVIGLAHGAVFGGALGLLACCDYVVAEEGTQFCFSEVKIGLSPAVISHFIIPKIPLSQVAPFMLTGQIFNTTQAFKIGLVHELVKETQVIENGKSIPKHEMHHAALKFTDHLKKAGPEAVAATKKLIQKMQNINSEDHAKKECTQVISERRVSAEGQEGLSSFLEKRKANWVIS